MTRDELRAVIHDELQHLERLFEKKNLSYGTESEAFYNFLETARRKFRSADLREAFEVLWVLADKHWVALGNQGLNDPEADQRLRDIAVCALIGLAMWWEVQRGKAKGVREMREGELARHSSEQAEFMRDFAPGKVVKLDGIETKIVGIWRSWREPHKVKVFLAAPSLPGAVPATVWGEVVDGELVFEVPASWKEAWKKFGKEG